MNFKLDALQSWEGVVNKEKLQFEAPEPRRVRLAFLTNAPTEIWASFPLEPQTMLHDGTMVEKNDPEYRDVLVGFGEGQFETEFTTHGLTYVTILTDDEASVFVRGFAPDMRVPQSEDETYTSIMPRERRNTEFDRMVMWTKLNEARREQQLQEAIAALHAASAAVPNPAPNPASGAPPNPAPNPASVASPNPAPNPQGAGSGDGA